MTSTIPTPRPRSVRPAWPLLVLALLAAAVLVNLVPDPARAAGAGGGAVPGKAWVRVGHFVPGMGSTSIELTPLDSSAAPLTLAGSATYGEVSAYDQIAPGSYTATVRDSSAAPDSAPMLSRSFEVAANDARTVAVVGTAAAPRLALLTDDLTPPQAGTARVRVLSAADDDQPVTVSAVDGPTIASGAVLGQATAYASVPAGTWTLRLTGGTADATLADVPVTSGSVYTVVVLDSGSSSVKLDVVTDAAGAVVAPKGGARTGLGGTAASPRHDPAALGWWLGAGVAGAVLLALVGTGLSRRRVVPAESR